MRQNETELLASETLLLLYVVSILILLAIFVIVFVLAFQRRKNKLIKEKYEAEKQFEKELGNSRIEIQEQTFKNIAWELHDYVGQLLSVAKMQLTVAQMRMSAEDKENLDETKDIIGTSLDEIRSLSKTLNSDVISNVGLVASLKKDLERFNRLKFIKADILINGSPVALRDNHEIIIFRILQEFCTNVLKHAQANSLKVVIDYGADSLLITAADDGVGFNTKSKTANSGLQTMKGRAALINATLQITSEEQKGTNLNITYPYT